MPSFGPCRLDGQDLCEQCGVVARRTTNNCQLRYHLGGTVFPSLDSPMGLPPLLPAIYTVLVFLERLRYARSLTMFWLDGRGQNVWCRFASRVGCACGVVRFATAVAAE